MNSIVQYITGIYKGIASLLGGMKVTGYYFLNARKEIITSQYPENRDTLKMFERFRGEVIMPHYGEDDLLHACTGCSACEVACPNGTIEIISNRVVDEETGKKKKIIDQFVYHLSMCTMCGLCIPACPTDAIKMVQNFEHAVYDRHKLTKVLNEPGSSLDPEVKE